MVRNVGVNDTFDVIIIGVLSIILVFAIASSILVAIGQWAAYKKAGKKGWAALVPIYNTIVLLEIAELPTWYVILTLLPFVNVYIMVKTYIEFVKKYRLNTVYAVGLLLAPIVFWLLIGLGTSKYYKEA